MSWSIMILMYMLVVASALRISTPISRYVFSSSSTELSARRKVTADIEEAPAFIVGEDIPEEVKNYNCIYDMILVERVSAPDKTSFGLLLPKVEGKDQKRVAKVLSIPTTYGLESEQGRVAEIPEIIPYKVGDLVFVRDPWGIGPKQIEVGNRCFSFHKAIQIVGRIVQ